MYYEAKNALTIVSLKMYANLHYADPSLGLLYEYIYIYNSEFETVLIYLREGVRGKKP